MIITYKHVLWTKTRKLIFQFLQQLAMAEVKPAIYRYWPNVAGRVEPEAVSLGQEIVLEGKCVNAGL